jgi:hypothetical protein
MLPLMLPDQLGVLLSPRLNLELEFGRVRKDSRLWLYQDFYFFFIPSCSSAQFKCR